MLLLQDYNLAVGLEWTAYPDAKSAKAAAPKGGLYRHVVYETTTPEGNTAVMAFYENPDPKAKKDLQAGALLLALSGAGNGTCIIHHRISDQLVWVCAVVSGVPVQGQDLVLPPNEAIKHLQHLKHDLQNPPIYGDLAESRGGLSTLLDLIDPKDIKKATLKKDSKALIILIAGVAAVLLTAAIVGFFVYQKIQRDEEQRQLEIQQTMFAEQARLQAEALAKYIAEKKEQFYIVQNPNELLSLWLEVLNALPISTYGWSPKSLTCTATECTTTWHRHPSVFPSSYERLPSHTTPILVDNSSARTQYNLPEVSTIVIEPSSQGIRSFFNDLTIYQNPYSFTYNEPSPRMSGVPEGHPNLDDQVSLGTEGDFTYKANSVASFSALLPIVSQQGTYYTGFEVGEITGARDSMSLTLKGAYKLE